MKSGKIFLGYEGLYQVSNLGQVKSLDYHRTGKEKILKPGNNGINYLFVSLHKEKIFKRYYIHRLVAETFIKKTEEDIKLNRNCIDHIDGNRQNNCVNNLRWCTYKENNNFELVKNTRSQNKKVYCVELDKEFISIGEAARQLNVHRQCIYKVCKHYKNTTGGYHFNYSKDNISNFKLIVPNFRLTKKVYCVELDKEFISIGEAARQLNLSDGNICLVCQDKRKSTGGYHFRYI